MANIGKFFTFVTFFKYPLFIIQLLELRLQQKHITTEICPFNLLMTFNISSISSHIRNEIIIVRTLSFIHLLF